MSLTTGHHMALTTGHHMAFTTGHHMALIKMPSVHNSFIVRNHTQTIIGTQIIVYFIILTDFTLHYAMYELYCIAGKFGELTLFQHLVKESLANQ